MCIAGSCQCSQDGRRMDKDDTFLIGTSMWNCEFIDSFWKQNDTYLSVIRHVKSKLGLQFNVKLNWVC